MLPCKLEVFGVLASVLCFAAGAAATSPDRVPRGLSAEDWSSIHAAYEAGRHAAFPVEGGWQARNPGQQWRTCFDGRGFVVTPDSGDWTWGLELLGYAGADSPDRARRQAGLDYPSRDREGAGSQPVSVEAHGGRVSYQWDDTLTEWYVNDPRGLEHGYTVHRRPEAIRAGSASARTGCGQAHDPSLALRARSESLLQLTLGVRGDLRPRIRADGRDVTFVNEAGAAVVNYSGLTVFDATGATVPAWFEGVEDSDGRDARTTHQTRTPHVVHSVKYLRLVVDDAYAVYPLTIDPIAQQAYLKASNTDIGDEFGSAVAVSGDTVVVGAPNEDSNATGVNGNQADNSVADAGAAYVFVRTGGTWSQQAYLKGATPGFKQFGQSVAVSGDTVAVGAPFESRFPNGQTGFAYIFVRDANGVWSQQADLLPLRPDVEMRFGWSVSISGDTLVVGSPFEDNNATGINPPWVDNSNTESGAAYVFVRNGNVWTQQAYFKASNAQPFDFFGLSVAVSGDTAVVGAPLEDSAATGVNGNQADNSAADSGAAYVFARDAGGVWTQQAYLKASNTGANDLFGGSVAVSGDTAVVGAPNEDSAATGVNGDQADNSAADAGAAYVFFRDAGGVWTQQAYLKASNTDPSDAFGASVAASGDTLVIGAPSESSSATGVNGDQANNAAVGSGAAYVFTRSDGAWSQQAYLKASNTESFDGFGRSVALSGDTAVIGATSESSGATGVNGDQNDNSADASGAAYVFAGLGPVIDCPGDANGDRRVDFADITTVLVNFGNTYPPGPPGPGDTNGDGIVNFADVTTVLVNFGRVCP